MKVLFFDGNFKECVNCGEIKRVNSDTHLSDFPKQGGQYKDPRNRNFYKTHCKRCWNDKNIYQQLAKEQAQNPNCFWECDHCDYIVRVKNKHCNRCGHIRVKK